MVILLRQRGPYVSVDSARRVEAFLVIVHGKNAPDANILPLLGLRVFDGDAVPVFAFFQKLAYDRFRVRFHAVALEQIPRGVNIKKFLANDLLWGRRHFCGGCILREETYPPLSPSPYIEFFQKK
jgi:hypothetical protein